jgi:hypothetical protein
VREEVADSILRGYQASRSPPSPGRRLRRPSAFLGQLSTMSGFNDLQDSMFDDYSTELVALDLRRAATAERVAEIAETTDRTDRNTDVTQRLPAIPSPNMLSRRSGEPSTPEREGTRSKTNPANKPMEHPEADHNSPSRAHTQGHRLATLPGRGSARRAPAPPPPRSLRAGQQPVDPPSRSGCVPRRPLRAAPALCGRC